MGRSGQPVLFHLDGANQIQAQQGQVCEVVLGQAFAVQVGVDEAQALETRRRGAEAVQGRNEDLE
jgi:hypothetical protein